MGGGSICLWGCPKAETLKGGNSKKKGGVEGEKGKEFEKGEFIFPGVLRIDVEQGTKET